LLWASDTYALLVVFQALDAAGKDSTIEHVMSGVTPHGVNVLSFKQPSSEELRRSCAAMGIALLAIIAVTTIGLLERIFGTVELSFSQWSICIGIAASLVAVEELIKLVVRQRDRRRAAPATRLSVSEA
jgi:hypothetical protein